ncbi:MAG TPA: hypothetical protein VN039_03345 [Nitrospira sp.]|nr:hypothetical protein [Nitrospira sp.]
MIPPGYVSELERLENLRARCGNRFPTACWTGNCRPFVDKRGRLHDTLGKIVIPLKPRFMIVRKGKRKAK